MAEAQDYRIDLPAVAASVALARLFVATVLRVHDVDEAIVDDAKLAASELATASVLAGLSEHVWVLVHIGTDALEVRFGPLAFGSTAPERERLDLAKALFPTTRHDPASQTAAYTIAAVTT